MINTLITILKLNRDYSTNVALYYLKHIPIVNKFFGYTTSTKKLKSDTKFYFSIFRFFLPFILIYILLALFIDSSIKNLIISPNDFSNFFISGYISLFAFLGFVNNDIFKLSTPKTYALNFLKIDVNEYMKTNFVYSLVKNYLVHFVTLFLCHIIYLLSWYHIILLPLFIVFIKILSTTVELFIYSKIKKVLSYNMFYKLSFFALGVAVANVLPMIGYIFTFKTFLVLLPLNILISYIGLKYILNFDYKLIDKKLFYYSNAFFTSNKSSNDRDEIRIAFEMQQNEKTNINLKEEVNEKKVTNKTNIKSTNYNQIKINNDIKKAKSPFKYITNLFFKKFSYLLKPIILLISCIIVFCILMTLIATIFTQNIKDTLQVIILSSLPILPLLMYLCNITKNITKSLFFNCDASLLYYKFYKNQKTSFSIFVERFKKCILYNIIPTILLLTFVILISLFANITNPWFYIYTTGSILLLLLSFTTLHLFIYYIFQPYDYTLKKQHPLYIVFNIIMILIGFGISDLDLDAQLLFNWIALISIWFIPLCFILIYNFGYKTLKHKNV